MRMHIYPEVCVSANTRTCMGLCRYGYGHLLIYAHMCVYTHISYIYTDVYKHTYMWIYAHAVYACVSYSLCTVALGISLRMCGHPNTDF